MNKIFFVALLLCTIAVLNGMENMDKSNPRLIFSGKIDDANDFAIYLKCSKDAEQFPYLLTSKDFLVRMMTKRTLKSITITHVNYAPDGVTYIDTLKGKFAFSNAWDAATPTFDGKPLLQAVAYFGTYGRNMLTKEVISVIQ
jgi:hypothetical protein